MPRRKRSYLPGGAFHVVARTHWGEFWFEDLGAEIVDIISFGLKQTDAKLLALTIMSSHLHLVIRQGIAPLSSLLHPVCQRSAYAVHRRRQRKGYVMDYRFFDTPCLDQAHLRNAIMYTHRNPVAAGLCNDATDYPWSSAAAYAGASSASISALVQPAFELFASGLPDRTSRQDYSDFYAWYDTCKRLGPDEPRPHTPGVTDGDVYWMQNFGTTRPPAVYPRADLGDIVMQVLSELGPNLTIDDLRAGLHTRHMLSIRDTAIVRALDAGHRNIDVAGFLHTSDSTVSRVGAARVRIRTP